MTTPNNGGAAKGAAAGGGVLPPFHKVTDEQWEAMKAENLTWRDVAERYAQPEWCTYPNALAGQMGCWSLVGRMVTGEDYCRNCDCAALSNIEGASHG